MDRLAKITVALSVVTILWPLAGVRGAIQDNESIEDRYLKRSLCNTFGGCSGFETDLRFTGRSFSDKENRASYGRPPYSLNLPSRRPIPQHAGASRNHQPQQAEDQHESPDSWTKVSSRGYQVNNHQGPAFDNNIR